MKLQVLLDKIANDPLTFLWTLKDTEQTPTRAFGRLIYYDDENLLQETGITIIVKNKGQTTEEAAIKGECPDYLKLKCFKVDVKKKMKNYMTSHPEIDSFEIKRINEEFNFAEVTAYTYDSGSQLLITVPLNVYEKGGTVYVKNAKV